MTPRLRVARPAVALLAGALAVAGCGQGTRRGVVATGAAVSSTAPASTAGTLAPEDGQPGPGYEADPRQYLTPEQLEELKRAVVPVLAPTWLPEWTRGVRAVVILESGTWKIYWDAAYGAVYDAFSKPGRPFWLSVNGRSKLLEGVEPRDRLRKTPPSEVPIKLGAVRSYRWSPLNDPCPITLRADGEVISEDEIVWASAVMWFDGPKKDWYYMVEMTPGPACSRGLFTNADMLKLADSLMPLF